MTRMRRLDGDRGAAAVEFALLLPVLVLIIFGIIDFGRMMNARIVLSQAAYEAARAAAITDSTAAAKAAANRGVSGLAGTLAEPVIDGCNEVSNATDTASVTLTFTMKYTFPAFGDTMTLRATAVVPCL